MSRKRDYAIGIGSIAATLIVAAAVIYFWGYVQALQGYGYLGAFLVAVFGGATMLAPIPMTPVVLALGAVMKPAFAPHLGPVFVGAAAGLGDTLGGLSIYLAGYGGATPFARGGQHKLQAVYQRLMRLMETRGSLVLFVLSAVVNPFFYPTALAAGACRFGIRKYFIICWIGKTIKATTVATAGYWGLGSLLKVLGLPL